MVSFSKLLEVLSHLVLNPQPMFTSKHAQVLLRSLPALSLNHRTREDTLNMMKIVSHCPYASELFARESQLSDKILTTFFVERYIDDNEIEEGLRKVIHVVSANTNLLVPHLLTMIRRLSYNTINTNTRSREISSNVSPAKGRDEALADTLLLRVISKMPKNGSQIRSNGNNNLLSQKEMHKRRSSSFEKPELLFLISTLRHVASSRAANVKENDKGGIQQQQEQVDNTFLPKAVVDAVLQCVETLPMAKCDDVPLCGEDWILIAYLIGCQDTKLHNIGRRLWLQNISQFDLKKIDGCTRVPFAFMLTRFLLGLKGNMRRNSLILWIDIIARPDHLSMIKPKQMYHLIGDITLYAQTHNHDEKVVHKSILEGGLRAVNTLESISPALGVHTRLMFTKVSPFLQTSEELTKTNKRLNEILLEGNNIGSAFIREVADFLRYVRRTSQLDDQTYFSTVISLAQYVLNLLKLSPSLNQEDIAALVPAFTIFVSVLRSLEAMESTAAEKEKVEKDNKDTYKLLRELLEKISTAFLQQHALQTEISLVSMLLQIMELLGFASNTQYTTVVRELVIHAFRSVPTKIEDIYTNGAQNCYDLLLRSLHFHVLDAEVLSAASLALRHNTDVAALRVMSWEQRALMLERATAVYREIAHFFPTMKEARRLAKHLLSVVAVVAAEKVPSRTPRLHLDKPQEGFERRPMRRCAQTMWTLVLRVNLIPIPRTPVDRYLTPMLRFTSRHWVAAELVSTTNSSTSTSTSNNNNNKPSNEEIVKKDAITTRVSDEELSHEFIDVLLSMLHHVMVTVFTDRSTFYANMRRNRLIMETACEILYRNRDYISPSVWIHVHRTLSYMPPPNTTLHTAVMRLSLKNALHHMKTCGDVSVIDPKWIADMFSNSELIDDAELRVYLISLAEEQLEKINVDGPLIIDGEKTTTEPTAEEKALLICFNKILSTLRRGSVLYY